MFRSLLPLTGEGSSEAVFDAWLVGLNIKKVGKLVSDMKFDIVIL